MWQVICLRLPASTTVEPPLFSALDEAMQNGDGELCKLDVGLFFLRFLTLEEAQTVLQERLDLVLRSQEMVASSDGTGPDEMQALVLDHIRTLLAAEQEWLERTLQHLQFE
jgi:radical SAM superfamily enzyme